MCYASKVTCGMVDFWRGKRSSRAGLVLLWLALAPGLRGHLEAGVRITELMYHPASEDVREEFIEIHNPGPAPVNLAGWRFTTGVRFTFPDITLPAGGYLAVAADLETFARLHPGVTAVVGGWEGILSNSGQRLELVDATGRRVDAVRYADEGDWGERERAPDDYGHRGLRWASPADGGGRSLELVNLALPGSHGQNWLPSQVPHGTPGAPNSVAATDTAPLILTPAHFPVVPRSTDPVAVTVRLLDETPGSLTATLYYRRDGDPAFTAVPMRDDGQQGDGAAGDGVFGAVLPPAPDGTVIEFYFVAADAAGHVRTYPAPVNEDGTPVQSANLLYQVDDRPPPAGPGPLYRLILRAADLAELRQINANNNRSHAQFNATFISHEGRDPECRYLVGVRNRGNGSRGKRPQSFRVNFRNDDLWQEVSALNLNSQYTPVQLLGSALYRQAGLPTQSARPVQVRLNQTDLAAAGPPTYGFYAATEVLNSEFANHVFPLDPSGNLYRGIRLRAPGADLHFEGEDPAPYRENYFKRTNVSEDDWTDLIGLTRVLDREPEATYPAAVRARVNVEEWMLYFALETLVDNRETNLANGNNGDGEGDDYFLYFGKDDPRAQLLPYDLDTLLGQGDTAGRVNDSLWRMNANPVLRRFMTHPEFTSVYFRTLKHLADTVFAPEVFPRLVERTLDGLAPESLRAALIDFAAQRRAFVLSQIPLTLAVTNADLVATNGLFFTPADTVTLEGTANALNTRAVRVGGIAATWTAWTGGWRAEAVPLRPGFNRVVIEALDATGATWETAHVDVWSASRVGQRLSGSLSADQTWSPAEGPYLLTGTLTIPPGLTLTLAPGTTVALEAGADLVVADGGRLLAEGSAAAPIYFTRPPGSTAAWGGIVVNGSVGSPETRLGYVHIAGNGDTAVHAVGGTVWLDHVTFGTTDRQYLSLDGASFVVQHCTFPSATAAFELVHGTQGIQAGGRGLFWRNFFGRTLGYNDVVDFTGGNRPDQPIVQFLNNVFVGASDDHLDLDGTDAWVEGNLFLHAHRNGSLDSSSGVSGGNNGTRTSEVTVVNNLFFDCDQAATAKQGNFYVLLHNTIVRQTHQGGLDTEGGVVNLADEGTTPGAGFYLEGNIVDDAEQLVRNPNPAAQVTFTNNLLSLPWNGPGGGNLQANPLWRYVPRLEETEFTSWEAAQVMWDWLTPQPGSPARSAGAEGRDLGAGRVFGVSLGGLPEGITAASNLTLVVGFNRSGQGIPAASWSAGAGYTHYRWRLDDGPWSPELPLSEPLRLEGLAPGPHRLEVSGRRDCGFYQDDPVYGEDARPTRATWVVDPTYAPPAPRVRLNELLAANRSLLLEGATPDLVELFNPGAEPADLSGCGLSPDPANPYAFVFPAGTVIAPGGYLVLVADERTNTPGLHLGFALRQTGDALHLYDAPARGGVLLDSVRFGLQVPDLSLGRLADGSWVLARPTFGAPNLPVALGDPAGLRLNEWLAAAGSVFRDDYVELFNLDPRPVALGGLVLSDLPVCPTALPGVQALGVPGTVLPPLSFLGGRSHAVFLADGAPEKGADHLGFRLAAAGGALSLFRPAPADASLPAGAARPAQVLDCILYGPQVPDRAQGRQPDGGDTLAFFDQPTPGGPNPRGPQTTVTTLVFPLVSLTNRWSYWQAGDPGPGWAAEDFADTAWPVGQAPLGRDTSTLALPFNTPLTMGRMTYYFRTRFFCPTNPAGMTLRLQTFIDDGALVWLNDQPWYRQNLSAPNPADSTRADSAVDNARLEGPFEMPAGPLRAGENLLAVEVHQSSSSSSDLAFALRLDGVLTFTNVLEESNGVRLNEIFARNRSFTNATGLAPDWVELYNTADQPADLSDCSLSPDAAHLRRYIFPPGTVLPARGYLHLECEAQQPASATNTGFDLPGNGGALFFFDRPDRGGALLDALHFGLQAPDFALGRVPDGIGPWQLTRPDLGTANQAVPLGEPRRLRLNEWLARPTSGDDWFELFNPEPHPVALGGLHLTDNLNDRTRHPLPPLSFIASHGFAVFLADGQADAGAHHVNFKLDADGEALGLFDAAGAPIDTVTFGPQEPDVSEGRLPDGGPDLARFPGGGTPGASNGTPPVTDRDGDGLPDDWERLYGLDPDNPADADSDLDGDGLSNRAEFLAGTRPDDPASALALTVHLLPGGGVQLRFEAAAGRTYTVLRRDSLTRGGWEKWADLAAEPVPRQLELTDPAEPSPDTQRFYLLVTPALP